MPNAAVHYRLYFTTPRESRRTQVSEDWQNAARYDRRVNFFNAIAVILTKIPGAEITDNAKAQHGPDYIMVKMTEDDWKKIAPEIAEIPQYRNCKKAKKFTAAEALRALGYDPANTGKKPPNLDYYEEAYKDLGNDGLRFD